MRYILKETVFSNTIYTINIKNFKVTREFQYKRIPGNLFIKIIRSDKAHSSLEYVY